MSAPAVTIALPALAALAIPGLPATRQGLERRAQADGWERRRRDGRGGGYVYVVTGAVAEAVIARQGRRLVASNDVRRPVGRPKGSDYFTRHPEVADAVEAILARQQLAAPRVRELLETRFAEPPHLRALQRFMVALETAKPALLASTRDPDLYRSQFRLALGRADGDATHAHQYWELDTTPADVLCADGRWAVLGVIDRWSRRARFLVAPSESGQSVRRLLVDTITAWGVLPETVVTDNGSGYINASIAASLEALGIAHRPAPPGSPEKKPFIERVFGTFTRERAELLTGYAGHNVGQAQRLRAAAKKETGRAAIVAGMTSAELQAVLTNWTEGVYHQRRHGTTGQSPMQRWMASPVPAAAAPPRDQLLVALSAVVGQLVVGKKGLRWKRGSYWSPALVPFVGRPVLVRRDEDDLGQLFAFDTHGRFIDVAVNAERSGLSEEAFATEARRHQAKWMAEARAEIRVKARAFDIDAARDALLRRDAEAAGKLVALPRPGITRSTPQLDSLAQAPAPALPDEATIRRAEARAPRAAVAAPPIADKVATADRALAAHGRGEPVDATALRHARAYASSAEYRAEKMLAADFGAPASTTPATRLQEKRA